MDSLRIASLQWLFQSYERSTDWWNRLAWEISTARADYKADLILLPEYVYADHPGYWPSDDEIRAKLQMLSAQLECWIIGGSAPFQADDGLRNRCWISSPGGESYHQDKIHITPWERETWNMIGGDDLLILEISGIKVAIAICYDVEFPEQIRALADRGAEILCVPFCTDDENGFHRVTHCARARAVENTMYVITAGCVGTVRGKNGFAHHFASSIAATPCDIGFPIGGLAAAATPQVAHCLIVEFDLKKLRATRANGTVLPRENLRRDLLYKK